MAEETPLFVDVSSVYSGDELGLPYRDIMGEGVVEAGDLLCSKGAGGTMNVLVAKGAAWIAGDDNTDKQPTYRVFNNGSDTVTLTAASGVNPRNDLIIAKVIDQTFAGGSREFLLDKVTGTPGATPADPAVPNNAIVLARVLVPTSAADIVACTLTDLRGRASVGGGKALSAGGGGWGAWG